MKNPISIFPPPQTEHDRPGRVRQGSEPGFALIVTVSLLVLLALIAVGLLTLSTITVRGAANGSAQTVAQANARLALMMALGELQKAAGSDQRVTASARLKDPDAPLGLTGVWSSWRPPVNASNGYRPDEKDALFRRWLVSMSDPDAQTSPDVPTYDDPDHVTLLDIGTLGDPVNGEPLNTITAEAVPVADNQGHLAWAVIDEGVKARLNLLPDEEREKSETLAVRSTVAGSAHRDAVWHQEAMKPILNKPDELPRLVTWSQSDILLEDSTRQTSGPFFNDFTVVSRGLLTNTADGGLKKDLSLLFAGANDSLPDEYANERVYPERTGLEASTANPYWSMLEDYATKYQDLDVVNRDTGIKMSVPSDADLRGSAASSRQPRSAILAPVIARVELVFSLVARDAHGPWRNRVPNKPLMIHMVYSPVVTLYNPYNVPISFDEIEVEFEDLPIGFQMYRNRQPMTNNLASFNQFYVGDDGGNRKKSFGFRLKEQLTSSSRSGEAVIEPGATRIFGINAPPTLTWGQDVGVNGSTIFDWRKEGMTEDFVLARGWTSGMGFDIDWMVPASAGRTPAFLSAHAGGVLHASTRDSIDVAFGPAVPPQAGRNGSFFVNVSLSSGRRPVNFSRIEVNYGDIRRLTSALQERTDDNRFRFPIRLERPVSAGRIYESNNTALRDYSRILPFAAFSIRGKTTFDSNEWVRSWADSSPVARASVIDFRRNKSQAKYPYEVALRPVVPNTPDGSVDLDAADRGFYFSGNSAQTGTKIAAAYEIPLAPLQSVAQLRHANLNSSGQLPAVTYTAGESRLHPLLPADGVTATDGANQLLDHTWLANDALWDEYFFSTLAAEQGRAYGNKQRSRETVIGEFLKGEAPLPNARFTPTGHGDTWAKETQEILLEADGYTRAAEFLLQDGDFNVNSISVPAWMAVLGGLDDRTLALFELKGDEGNQAGNFQSTEETIIDSAFPRLRRPLGGSIDRAGPGGLDRDIFWTGFRELGADASDTRLRELAGEIVQVIKERGPFLSMAEFVNRQIGPAAEEASLAGTLQSAIDRSDINSNTSPLDGEPITPVEAADYGYATPEAVLGSTATGYPGDLSQGDLLSLIGSRISVRSDTFKIRAYGDAVDRSGKVLARAWCEATVQRVPEFVDGENSPAASIDKLTEANKNFGRRFVVTGFRWLSTDEI